MSASRLHVGALSILTHSTLRLFISSGAYCALCNWWGSCEVPIGLPARNVAHHAIGGFVCNS